jgi:hypothetical protein
VRSSSVAAVETAAAVRRPVETGMRSTLLSTCPSIGYVNFPSKVGIMGKVVVSFGSNEFTYVHFHGCVPIIDIA